MRVNTRWIKPVPKKEAKANHHIERDRDVSPGFPRYSISFFFSTLSFVSRANERANDARLRGAHVLSIVLPHGERIFIGGEKKKGKKNERSLLD